MSEKKIAETKEGLKEMIEKLSQGNIIAVMRNNELIKAVEYDEETAKVWDVVLKAAARGFEK